MAPERLFRTRIDIRMDLTEQVEELFHHNINCAMQGIDSLSHSIANTSEYLVRCMLNERKILCCGEGASGLVAQIFATILLDHFQYERPALPAVSLNSDAATLTAIATSGTYSDIFAKQIQAIGQEGDILLCCFQGEGSGALTNAIQAAHERNIQVITLGSRDPSSGPGSLLTNSDIALCMPTDDRARCTELQVFTVHALCALIDQQLFGSEV